jgi:sortase A
MTHPPAIHFDSWRKAAAAVVIAAGIVCVSDAVWIHVKASLAQVLIGVAWRRAQAASGNTQSGPWAETRPWPGAWPRADARPWPWADTRPVAQVTFGAGANARKFTVLEGSSGRNLAFGPTHDPASVAPGDPGNSVIEGHRDTHFALLRDLKVGDRLQVETLAGRHVNFRVTNLGIVDSRRARIALDADAPRLTLVTCYPFDAVVPGGPLRWVVTADRIEP